MEIAFQCQSMNTFFIHHTLTVIDFSSKQLHFGFGNAYDFLEYNIKFILHVAVSHWIQSKLRTASCLVAIIERGQKVNDSVLSWCCVYHDIQLWNGNHYVCLLSRV